MARLLCLIAGLLATLSAALAQSITIGLAADITSIDPHYQLITPNQNVDEHIFEALILKDDRQRLRQGLATSWKPIDDTTWELALRRGVKFHDGSDFTAEDVAFSLARPATIRNSPSPFTVYTRSITAVEIVDPYSVRVKTAAPYPLLPTDLSVIPIVSKKLAANATTEDFNSGRAAIGTGAFKLVRWVKGDRVELVRNDAYWGQPPAWERVTFRFITNDAARVAALLAGDVQAIEAVPTADVARLKRSAQVSVYESISYRLMYLHMDSNRDTSPYVTDKAGRPLARNPLKDARVRRALSMAINRPVIVERVMEHAAVISGQLMANGFFGYTAALRPEHHDIDAARRLLAAAGWPDGFAITIHGTNDRYVNDERVAQSLAQMLTRAGIPTTVVTMPSAVYFPRANRLEFSVMLVGWGADTGEASSPLKALLATFDRDKGMGTANRGRYSNAQMDAVLTQALATVADGPRERLLQQATEIAIGDVGIIPLYHQMNIWATRKGITYTPRTDERTYAREMRPQ